MNPNPFIQRAFARPCHAVVTSLLFLLVFAWAGRAATPEPSVTLSVPASVRIGDPLSISATFNNTSPDETGYGPFIDIAVDTTGKDGIYPGTPSPANTYDGISVNPAGSITYLGFPLNYQVLTLDDTTNGGFGVKHPYAVDTSGNPVYVKTTDLWLAGKGYAKGDQLIVIELPFGSFTPEQPSATIDIAAILSNLADLNQALPITARGGFRFGKDALNNPSTDPSLFQITPVSDTVQPTATLLTLTKVYIGPENETATGPNFPRRYRLDVDVANGQTIANLHILDNLPPEMQYVRMTATNKNGSAFAGATQVSIPSTTVPGGAIDFNLGSVTGGAGVDASIEFEFFVPRLYASNNRVLPADTADDKLLNNQAYTYGDWTPIDTRDAAIRVADQATVGGDPDFLVTPDADPEHVLEAQANAIQKSAAVVRSPFPERIPAPHRDFFG